MSITFGSEPTIVLRVTLGKSKFDRSKPIYMISLDGDELYGKPVITMEVGRTYKFEIDTPRCPFYITADPHGGGFNENEDDETLSMKGAIEIVPENTLEKGNVGIEKGTITWTPKLSHSNMSLYYQCNYFPDLGNKLDVIVV